MSLAVAHELPPVVVFLSNEEQQDPNKTGPADLLLKRFRTSSTGLNNNFDGEVYESSQGTIFCIAQLCLVPKNNDSTKSTLWKNIAGVKGCAAFSTYDFYARLWQNNVLCLGFYTAKNIFIEYWIRFVCHFTALGLKAFVPMGSLFSIQTTNHLLSFTASCDCWPNSGRFPHHTCFWWWIQSKLASV